MPMDTIARKLARYSLTAEGSDFPLLARSRAVDAITDCVACMLAGSREALARMVIKVISAAPRDSERATLLGTALYSTPADAALYNGAIAHSLDYDDISHPGYAHSSAAIVPAMFAVANLAGARGQDLVTGYILGLEVIGKLGRALNIAHYQQGWHATSTFGTLAAAVSAGRLLHLSEQQMVMALGIAASAAGGVRANFGTMVKPLHAGYAARNGVLAALLAREGMVANEEVFEHKNGYCNVFNHGVDYDLAPLSEWGEPLEILSEFGLALKPFPSCGSTHPGIEAALRLREEIRGTPIRTVYAGVSDMAMNFGPPVDLVPETGLDAKFSLRYCLAAALTDGAVNMSTFTDTKVKDPAIRALMSKITRRVDDRVRDDHEMATVLEIETARGERHELLIPFAIGKPGRWFSAKQLRDKFEECALRAVGPQHVERIFRASQGLDDAPDTTDLFAALSGT